MHLDDVRCDLKYGNLLGVERAFAALVTGDDHIEGLGAGHDEAPEQALALLRAIIVALGSDRDPLPHSMLRALRAVGLSQSSLLTFADGAVAVAASLPRWATLLAERYPIASGSDG